MRKVGMDDDWPVRPIRPNRMIVSRDQVIGITVIDFYNNANSIASLDRENRRPVHPFIATKTNRCSTIDGGWNKKRRVSTIGSNVIIIATNILPNDDPVVVEYRTGIRLQPKHRPLGMQHLPIDNQTYKNYNTADNSHLRYDG